MSSALVAPNRNRITFMQESDDTGYFRLDPSFLAQFQGKKPRFGFHGLGEFVFYRTYSRKMADGRKETFCDMLQRVVEGCFEIQRRHCNKIHVPWDYKRAQVSAQEMFRLMWEFKFLPPGRGLWMMGTPFMWTRGSAALNNCGYVSTVDLADDPAEPFCFLMDMSMVGVGTGFDTKGANKLRICDPGHHQHQHTVLDSREGWVDALRQLILSYTTNAGQSSQCYDYSQVRKAGSDIHGFGGKASGPGILIELLESIRNLFDHRLGKTLSSVDIADVMNLIGKCIVAGNVRRCLPKGTLVHLKRGLVPIEQVQIGDLVLTANGYHPVAENVHQGTQRVITIQSQLGQLRCTAKHLIAVMTGVGQYGWKRAHQLVAGDRMVFVDEAIPGTETVLPGYSNSMTRGSKLVVPGLTDDVAWFLGITHGDGYVYPGRIYHNRRHHGASVMIPVNRDEYHDAISEKVNAGFAAFGFYNPGEMPSKDNCRRIRVISRHLAAYLHKNFKQAHTPLGVPECIRLGTIRARGAYLAGLLDSDGSTKNRPTTLVVSVYYDFLRQAQAVYSSLAIPTKLKLRKPADANGQAKWELNLVGDWAITKFKELVQPYAVKQLRLTTHASGHDFGYPAEWIDREVADYGRSWNPESDQMTHNRASLCGAKVQNLVPVEVYAVVDEGIETDTYDLSVPDRSEFVAQGLLMHNTAEIAFGEPEDSDYCEMKNPSSSLQPEDMDVWHAVTGRLFQVRKPLEATAADFTVGEVLLHCRESLNGSYNRVSALQHHDSAIPHERLAPAIETWNNLQHHRWASNNSIYGRVGMNYDRVAQSIAVNGEPGIIWLANIQDYGRMIDGLQPGIDGGAMGSNPCVEQSLESYELCCLVETFPSHHKDAEDYMRTLKFAYLYAKTVTLLPTHNPRTNSVMQRNRRIGLSQSGIVQAFDKFGRRKVLTDFCDRGYKEVRRWDDIYSRWLCVTKSIKTTSVKPSGTVSLVAGVTPGIHYPEARTYWRRVRVAKNSTLLSVLEKAGYHIEPDVKDPERTVVVKFAVDDSRVPSVDQVSMWEQVANAADYQRYWADNQVSCTIKFHPQESKQIKYVLEVFEDRLKGISFLPWFGHGYTQAPYEPCTPAEVAEYNANIRDLDFTEFVLEDAIGTTGCDGDSCSLL